MRKKLIIIISLLFCLQGTTYPYELESSIIAPSGGQDLASPNYKIPVDIKGQPAVGKSLNQNYQLELGGLPALVSSEAQQTEEAPWGTVLLNIRKQGNDLKISWNTGSYGPNVGVFFLPGSGAGEFTNTNTGLNWKPASGIAEFDPHPSEGYVLHKYQINYSDAHKEVYYKALQEGVNINSVNPQGKNVLETASAVGKFDLNITRNNDKVSFFSFSTPLVPQEGDNFSLVLSPNNFVGTLPTGNLLEADQVRGWSGTQWQSFYKSSADSLWHETKSGQAPATHIFCKGYVLRLQPYVAGTNTKTFRVALIGKVLNTSYESNKAYGGNLPLGLFGENKFTAFGNPFPNLVTLQQAFSLNSPNLQIAAGANLLEADQVRFWDYLSGQWKSAYYDGTTWKLSNGSPAYNFDVGKGYIFRKADQSTKGAFIWKQQNQ